MKYLHTMIRIKDVDESLRFFCEGLLSPTPIASAEYAIK